MSVPSMCALMSNGHISHADNCPFLSDPLRQNECTAFAAKANGGRKNDGGKPLLSLVSMPAVFGLADVLTFGAKKYAADNWRAGFEWRRVINSLLRHSFEFSHGRDIDAESGLPIIDHVGCCWMFLSEHQKLGLGKDDRYHTPPRQPPLHAELRQRFLERIERSGSGVSDEFNLFSKGEVRAFLASLDE